MRYRKKSPACEAVQVLAADYNSALWGTEHNPFDSSPFSDVPDWFAYILDVGRAVPHDTGGTDYAQWTFDFGLERVNLLPGDWIVNENGIISYVRSENFKRDYEPDGPRVEEMTGHARVNAFTLLDGLNLSSLDKNVNGTNGQQAAQGGPVGSMIGSSSTPGEGKLSS